MPLSPSRASASPVPYSQLQHSTVVVRLYIMEAFSVISFCSLGVPNLAIADRGANYNTSTIQVRRES